MIRGAPLSTGAPRLSNPPFTHPRHHHGPPYTDTLHGSIARRRHMPQHTAACHRQPPIFHRRAARRCRRAVDFRHHPGGQDTLADAVRHHPERDARLPALSAHGTHRQPSRQVRGQGRRDAHPRRGAARRGGIHRHDRSAPRHRLRQPPPGDQPPRGKRLFLAIPHPQGRRDNNPDIRGNHSHRGFVQVDCQQVEEK